MSRNSVARRPFAVTVIFLVLMMAASDFVVWQIARGPSATQVKAQVDREIASRSAQRNTQFCAILAAVPRTPTTQAVRKRLGCLAALKPSPAPTVTKRITVTPKPQVITTPGPSRLVVTPGPRVTVTAHPRPPRHHRHHRPKAAPTPSCKVPLGQTCVSIPPLHGHLPL